MAVKGCLTPDSLAKPRHAQRCTAIHDTFTTLMTPTGMNNVQNLCRFLADLPGVKVQELAQGTGSAGAANGDIVVLNYVLRRANGYFIYSTVEGISFQPRDVPTEPFEFKLVRQGGLILSSHFHASSLTEQPLFCPILSVSLSYQNTRAHLASAAS